MVSAERRFYKRRRLMSRVENDAGRDLLAGLRLALSGAALRLGLACGGDLAAARAGGGGLRVFRGSACWDRRQLQLEKQRGVWVHARAGFHKGGQEALRQLAMGEASNGWRRALRAAGLPARGSRC
ncbi:unnamed protein product [Effrenium voratum]|uniref:Uncharacterized protein n=1 Tax=Effrenium voratum TaxID=2562239 RepID=A0AA36N861_9DINO|nr:unnamed protein product [Effrenium voratum]